MRSALAYRPPSGPFAEAGVLAATAFVTSLAVVAFAFANPIVLGGAAGAAIAVGILAGTRRALGAAARWGAALAVVVVVVNGLASQRGDTILVRGWNLPVLGQLDVSAEALAEGGVLAARVLVVMMAFAVYSASVDPDRTLRLLRPVARHSALTATLIARLVPLALADHARLREAVALRGPGAAAVGRGALVRRLVAGSLDRSVDVAATLELRGYARGAPRGPGRARTTRGSAAFAACGIAVAAAAVAARLLGVGDFEAYPTVMLDTGTATIAFATLLPLAVALPFLRRPHRG